MRSGSFFWFGRMVATMNFGDRSIVAKAITLRFVVVLGRLDLELPWIFFADQVCWWSFGFLLLQWWWSATMDHKNGHWSIYRVFSIVESPNPFRIFVSFRSRRKLWILYAIIIWICYNGSKFDDFVKVPLQCIPAPLPTGENLMLDSPRKVLSSGAGHMVVPASLPGLMSWGQMRFNYHWSTSEWFDWILH